MSLKCGIVGLPNIGIVEVPDARLERIAAIVKPAKVVAAITQFVDFAGLVAGASKGKDYIVKDGDVVPFRFNV